MRLNARGIAGLVAAAVVGAVALAGCVAPTAGRAPTTSTTFAPGTVFPILCPVPSPVYFVEDWQAPRSGGTFHQGNDLLATRGTPAVAVVAGVIRQKVGAVQGNAVWLDGDDGNQYFYAHFDSYVGVPRRVAAGETHVHFEIHPNHGDAVDAYPSDAAHCTRLTSPPAAS
jgi:hypothetical protein